jgi:cation diffusion facilitator family transporter
MEEAAAAEKNVAALSTVLAALLITLAKATVGLWTGSLGILAEAVDSALDVVAALLTFAAVRVSGRPADESHPYGHGKVENMAALVETLLLLVTCGWIIYEATIRLFFKSVEIDANAWAFGVVIVSMAIDFNRMRALQRTADKHDSQALQASALRFRTDIWTSSVVLLGLTLVRVQEWLGGASFLLKADAVAGLGVALVVLYLGVRLGKSAMEVLLDTAPEGSAQEIADRVEQIETVRSCSQVRVRRAGSQSFVELEVELDGDISFDRAHETTARVEEAVVELIPRADVFVHYEPSESSADIVSLVNRVAHKVGGEAHNVQVRHAEEGFHVALHLEVKRDASLEQAHEMATSLEGLIKEAAPEIVEVVVHLEPLSEEERPGHRLSGSQHARIEEQVVSLVDGFVTEGACNRVTIWEEEQGLVASLHCSLSPELSVEEAHDLSERLEAHLCELVPSLQRVVIHLEPDR